MQSEIKKKKSALGHGQKKGIIKCTCNFWYEIMHSGALELLKKK